MPDLTIAPCPFCGSADLIVEPPVVFTERTGDEGAYVWCASCQCTGPVAATSAEAVGAWNAPARFCWRVLRPPGS